MKLKLITLLFILKFVPSFAQTEVITTEKQADTTALKQVNVNAAVNEKAAPVLTTEQILDIQKSTLENQKAAEKIKAQAEADAKAVEKEQRKLEKEQKRFEKQQDRISDSEKDVIKTKERIIKETAKLGKMMSKLDKNKRKGRLSDIEIEKENHPQADSLVTEWLQAALSRGLVADGLIATSSQECDSVWSLREGITESLAQIGPVRKYDVAVPVSKTAAQSVQQQVTAGASRSVQRATAP